MDTTNTGKIIKNQRLLLGLTQKEVAEQVGVTEQAVSKWERGLCMPDIALCPQIADILGISVEAVLKGSLEEKECEKATMKNLKYYICPVCDNIITSMAETDISCCGRKLSPSQPKKAEDKDKMQLEQVEDQIFITTAHPMTKENYIQFTMFISGERLEVIHHYPEWPLELRIPKYRHGKFMWYAKDIGLLYQLI